MGTDTILLVPVPLLILLIGLILNRFPRVLCGKTVRLHKFSALMQLFYYLWAWPQCTKTAERKKAYMCKSCLLLNQRFLCVWIWWNDQGARMHFDFGVSFPLIWQNTVQYNKLKCIWSFWTGMHIYNYNICIKYISL